MRNDDDKNELFMILVNEEEQYSFWPKGMTVPKGWRATGTEGTRDECGTYVKSVWTDMRPLSLRKQMNELTRKPN
jgi:MbtH protein